MTISNEQAKKIIDEAPEGAKFWTGGYDCEYRKQCDCCNLIYGFVDGKWTHALDQAIAQERIDKGWYIPNLLAQLDQEVECCCGETDESWRLCKAHNSIAGQDEWKDGLPPIGEECEFKKKFQVDDMFSECYIIGIRNGAQTKTNKWLVFSDKYDNLHQHHVGQGVYVFRKPETEAEKAARLRGEAHTYIYHAIGGGFTCEHTSGVISQILDMIENGEVDGYRKVTEG